MSVKSGSKFIAGNLALKVQDRLFTAFRTLEGSQEYYDIMVPVGATLGFTEGTRLMVIIEGTNTTTTPILRYGTTELYIVSSTMITNEAKIGELIDGNLMDMFIKSLSDVKPGTSTPMIYLGRTGSDYGFITNTPRFIGRNLNEKPLVAGLNYYTTLGLPYIEGNTLMVNDIDILSIDTNIISYGKPDFSQVHTFVSTNRINWRVSPTQIEELATLRDIAELTIADQFVDVLVYTRNTIALMNAIDDMVIGDTCLTLENNTIYNWNGTVWVIQEVLNYNLTTDNGKYFDIEDIDGDNSGKAIWNIAEGGRFKVFTDYSSSIDGITIIRNPSSRALEVAKVPNSLTINNLDADGEVADTITFDGSSPQTFNVTIDFSNYYDKEDIDTWYNGATPGNLSKFFTDGDGNIKLQDANVVANDIVTKTSGGTYIQAQGSNVDASMIEFEDGSIEDFLDKEFAFVNAENDFVIGQSIAGELIATQDWAQNTFLPNNFDLNLLTGAEIQLNAPSAGRTSLRFARRNISSGATSNLDVELPIVNESNNGFVTPAQVATWNTVSNKVDKEHIDNGLTSVIDYQNHTPGMKSTYSDRSAEISILDDGATNGLRASFLSLNITDSLYSGILADKTGVYAFQNEGIAKNNAHRIATEGYVEQNVVLQDDIVTDLNNQWSGNKVVLGAFDFTIIGASSATYRQYGSNIATGAQVTYDRSFPIVTNSTAGLATAGLFNQVETNKAAIEALQGQGQVGAELPQPPSQSDIQNAWDTAKPTITAVEGSSVVDLITGNTWRLLDVEGTLTWVNLGVLGGTGIATNLTTGVVMGSASGSGTIFVENDGTMTVNGWDDVLSDITNIDLALDTLDSNYSGHIADIDPTNTAPHVTTQNRSDWNAAKTTADNAIPKVAAAVNNNLTMWSSGGVLKDSLLAIVTGFTTPTDFQVPTAKAVGDHLAAGLALKLDKKQSELDSGKTFVVGENGDVELVEFPAPTMSLNGVDMLIDPAKTYLVIKTPADFDEFTLLTGTIGSPNYTIEWGDGFSDNITDTSNPTHTYEKAGMYLITISGSFTNGIVVGNNTNVNKNKIIEVYGGTNYPTSVGNHAFYVCLNLTIATFPRATSVGIHAFNGCSNLTTATFPRATTISNGAFSGCSNLTTATFPKVTSIGEVAFYSCSSLTTATFPKVTSIGESAFHYCSSLTTATLPKATSVGNYAFHYCSNLKALTLGNVTTTETGTRFGNVKLDTLTISGTITDTDITRIKTLIISNGGSFSQSYEIKYGLQIEKTPTLDNDVVRKIDLDSAIQTAIYDSWGGEY